MIDEVRTIIRTFFSFFSFATASLYVYDENGFASQMKKDIPICFCFYF